MYLVNMFRNINNNKIFIECVNEKLGENFSRFSNYPTFFNSVISEGIGNFEQENLLKTDNKESAKHLLKSLIKMLQIEKNGYNCKKDVFIFEEEDKNLKEVDIVETKKELNENNVNYRGRVPKDKDFYQKIRKKLPGWNGSAQPVVCINNEKFFNSLDEATEWANLKSKTSIRDVCNMKRGSLSAGKDQDTKEKFYWMYAVDIEDLDNIPTVEEYIKMRKELEEKEKKINKLEEKEEEEKSNKGGGAVAVYCKEDNVVYASQRLAANSMGMANTTGISNCCHGRIQTCGGKHWYFASQKQIDDAMKTGRYIHTIDF